MVTRQAPITSKGSAHQRPRVSFWGVCYYQTPPYWGVCYYQTPQYGGDWYYKTPPSGQ